MQVLSVADDRDWLRLILEKLGLLKVSTLDGNWGKAVCVVMASNSYPYGEGTDEDYSFSDDDLSFDKGVVFRSISFF